MKKMLMGVGALFMCGNIAMAQVDVEGMQLRLESEVISTQMEAFERECEKQIRELDSLVTEVQGKADRGEIKHNNPKQMASHIKEIVTLKKKYNEVAGKLAKQPLRDVPNRAQMEIKKRLTEIANIARKIQNIKLKPENQALLNVLQDEIDNNKDNEQFKEEMLSTVQFVGYVNYYAKPFPAAWPTDQRSLTVFKDWMTKTNLLDFYSQSLHHGGRFLKPVIAESIIRDMYITSDGHPFTVETLVTDPVFEGAFSQYQELVEQANEILDELNRNDTKISSLESNDTAQMIRLDSSFDRAQK